MPGYWAMPIATHGTGAGAWNTSRWMSTRRAPKEVDSHGLGQLGVGGNVRGDHSSMSESI